MKKYKGKEVAAELGIKMNTLTKRVQTYLAFEKTMENYSHKSATVLLQVKLEALFGRFRFTRIPPTERDDGKKPRASYQWKLVKRK